MDEDKKRRFEAAGTWGGKCGPAVHPAAHPWFTSLQKIPFVYFVLFVCTGLWNLLLPVDFPRWPGTQCAVNHSRYSDWLVLCLLKNCWRRPFLAFLHDNPRMCVYAHMCMYINIISVDHSMKAYCESTSMSVKTLYLFQTSYRCFGMD